MLKIAVVDFEVNPEYFWDMSIYEFGLFSERVRTKTQYEVEKLRFIWETSWDQTRTLWAAMINRTGGDKNGNAISPQDLFQLPNDKKNDDNPKQVSLKLMRQKFGSTFKYGVN